MLDEVVDIGLNADFVRRTDRLVAQIGHHSILGVGGGQLQREGVVAVLEGELLDLHHGQITFVNRYYHNLLDATFQGLMTNALNCYLSFQAYMGRHFNDYQGL